jgi:DNA mismatch repair protein MSH5
MIENCKSNGFETEALVARFIQVARPNLVLVGTRIVNNVPLLEMLTKAPPPLPDEMEDERKEGEDEAKPGAAINSQCLPTTSSSTRYLVLKSGSYNIQNCKAVILQKLRIVSIMKDRQDQGQGTERQYNSDSRRHFQDPNTTGLIQYEPSRFHCLATVIDFDSIVLVKALGSLLSHLEKTIFQLDGGIIRINRIVEAKISECMLIGSATLAALHIFAEEAHPLILKKQGKSKEGFSLFSMLDRTLSRGGRRMLREWMLKPLIRLESINTRLDAIDLFLKPSLQTQVGTLVSLLKKVGAVDSILIRMQKCASLPKDFLVLKTSLLAMVMIDNVLRNDVLGLMVAVPELTTRLCFDYFSDLLAQINQGVIEMLQKRISETVDEEATKIRDLSSESVAIRYGYDTELDNLRQEYEDLAVKLDYVGQELYQQNPQLTGLNVVFMPQIGFLVGLSRQLVDHANITLPPDFEHIFNQDDEAYFKCEMMEELDEEHGDLDALIRDREQAILAELEENILDAHAELNGCFRAISTLDCLLAFTDCSAEMGFTRPHINDAETDGAKSQVVYAKDARHPLLALISDQGFVPNDIRIDEDHRVVVVTGPNYSGKSCYLRQVGLLVYMAHIGCFVPASQATISLTDQILARFSTLESWSRPQSGYQQECTEVATILHNATWKSLVLLDEVGKGTHPASGVAILGASLQKLSALGCSTVCSTHFLELFSMNILKDQEQGICTRQMSVYLPEKDDDNNVVPLFKLQDGVATSSAGLACAKHAGVENDVIERARQVISMMRRSEGIEPLRELTGDPQLADEEIDLLQHFYSIENWKSASDDELRILIQKVSKLSLDEEED